MKGWKQIALWGLVIALVFSFAVCQKKTQEAKEDEAPKETTLSAAPAEEAEAVEAEAVEEPVAEEEKQPAEEKPVEAEEKLITGKGNVLVMDDNEMVLKGCRKLLSAIGYEVDLAEEGEVAIEKYIKAKKSGRPFNVVILDLTIPGGMGGEETIKRLFEIDPEVKAIVSSGYADNPVMSDHRRYGFKTVLAKPYNAKKMSKAVHDVMAGIYD